MTGASAAPLLRVGCAAQCGRPGAGGHLIVEPGAARFEFRSFPGRILKVPPVIHAQPPLVWKRARLLPPLVNTGLIMRGEEGVVTVYTWWGARGRIRRALDAAGVAYREEPTWFSIGWGEGAGTRPFEP